MHRPFSALALGGFLTLLDGGTVRAVPLVFCLWYKVCFTDLALLSACRLHNFGKQFIVSRKHGVFEIATVDSIPTDTLHTGVFFAVVQQKTVAVHIIAAKLFNESVDPL